MDDRLCLKEFAVDMYRQRENGKVISVMT